MSQLRKSVAAYSGLLVLSVIWGLAFVAIRQADKELAPVNLALLRWFVACVPFLVLLPVIGRSKTKLERRDIPRLLVMAFANVAGYHVSLNYAETALSAGLSALLTALGPIFIAVLSYLVLQERAGRKVVLGLVLAFAGTAVLSTGSVEASDFSSLGAVLAGIGTALCYATFTVLAKPLVHKYGSASTTIMAGLIGTVMMLPLLSPSFVAQVGSLSAYGWSSVLYLSLLSTVFGYLMFYTLVSRGAVTRLSIQLYLIPVVSVIGGALILGEAVTLSLIVGGGLMLAAVALATRK